MKRIFISHSSSDKKSFVDPLVECLKKSKISEQQIIYDQLTFEPGKLIENEIKEWLGDNTDLFVLLISDESLNSDWVQKEIMQSEYLEEESVISKIFPIIIDKKISYDDSRIPDWLSEKYNIKAILAPWAAASKIVNKRIEVIYELYPDIQKKHELFVGRNNEIKAIEERFADFEKEQPISVIFSGLLESGRRSCAKFGFSKMSIIKRTHQFLTIRLDQHQSIEDFIFAIVDLGVVNEVNMIQNISILKYKEKVEICYQLITEIINSKQILQIIDNGTLITYDSNLAKWFTDLNIKLFENNYRTSSMIIISRFKPNMSKYINKDFFELIFNIPIPLLDKSEINSLFLAATEINKIDNVSRAELAQISHYFNGYPGEILHTVDFISKEGANQLLKNPDMISSFSEKNIKQIVEDLLSDKDEKEVEVKDMLAVLAMYDFISYSLLIEIIPFDFAELLKKFISGGILENFGTTTEYLTMNTAVKNFILRQQWEVSPEINKRINNHVKNFMENYSYNAPYTLQDLSDKNFSFKFSLKNNIDLEKENIIPSYYLKAMKDLYDGRNKDSDVIKLADRALTSSVYIDPHIINEIRFFLCSALARQKNERFKEEVSKLSGSVYYFLYGFYYRLLGEYRKAVFNLEKAQSERRSYAQAQRELVQCYIRLEEYDKAYKLAKQNYENTESNEFHIQSYFKVTSFAKIPLKQKKEELSRLLIDIKKIDTDRAKNMGYIMEAEYELYFNEDTDKAEKIIMEATAEFPSSMYIKLFEIELFFKQKNLKKLEKLEIDMRKKRIDSNHKYSDQYLKLKAYIEILKGNRDNAVSIMNDTNFSKTTKETTIAKINNI